MTEARAAVDWEAIEREYRAGTFSIREIAKQHGVSDTAIRKRAKAKEWRRDLSEKVKEQVRTDLVRTLVRTTSAETKHTEREIVAGAAQTVVALITAHRIDIRRGREVATTLLAQLEGAAGNRDELEEIIREDTADCENPAADKGAQQRAWTRRGQMLRAISLPQHAATVRDLSTALGKLVALERQAFSVEDGGGELDEDGKPVGQRTSLTVVFQSP